jgi:chromosome partitioning protein
VDRGVVVSARNGAMAQQRNGTVAGVRSMQTIAVTNQKGGVGKTTSAVTLAAIYAEQGKRVLLLDVDPQGHASRHVGMRPARNSAMRRLLTGEGSVAELATATPYGFDLLAATRDLGTAQHELASDHAFNRLRDLLAAAGDRWDLAICDCPPALNELTVVAFYAAECVIVPMLLEALSLDSLGLLEDTISRIRAVRGGLRVGAIFATRSDPRTLLARSVVEAVQASTFGRLAATQIRQDTLIATAPLHGQPITTFAPTTRGTEDYRALAAELVNMGAIL